MGLLSDWPEGSIELEENKHILILIAHEFLMHRAKRDLHFFFLSEKNVEKMKRKDYMWRD